MVFLFFGLSIILASLFIIQPVYAGHCDPGSQFLITHHIQTYCVGSHIYIDVDNCDDPAGIHHRPYRNCADTNEQCYKNPASVGDYSDTAEGARCIPIAAPGATADTEAGLKQIEDVFKNVISVVVGLGFIASLIMLIFAGFKYLTSGGEPKAVQAAHQTFAWALLGILFLAIAWLVLKLIEAFTGVPVTFFDIKTLCRGGAAWCQ